MRLALRADASPALGSGHVMRCLALAEGLAERGWQLSLISRNLPAHLGALAAGLGVEVRALPGAGPCAPEEDARQTASLLAEGQDWLVVDHYLIDAAWERLLRLRVRRLMVIDDLADRPHDCDLLLDQNLAEQMELRYRGLVPCSARLLLGPANALLRREFVAARRALAPRDGRVRRILVCFGGSDPSRETEKTLAALALPEFRDIVADVVVGGSNPRHAELEASCRQLSRANFLHQASDMARLMARADLALGAGGSSAWERCYMGLPTLTITVAHNQEGPARAAHRAGLARLVGRSAEVTAATLAEALSWALHSPTEIRALGERCLAFLPARRTPLPDQLLDALNEVPDEP